MTVAADISPPDWSKIDREILCPLCEYSLRGLTEPRCPECGHRFEWAEVLSPTSALRWLYEHAPRRIGSFFGTWLVSLLSVRFWRQVRPIHAVRPRRLLMYMAGLLALNLVMILLVVLFWSMQTYRLAVQSRQRQIASQTRWIQKNPQDFQEVLALRRLPTTQAYLDRFYPEPDFWTPFSAALFSPRIARGGFNTNLPHWQFDIVRLASHCVAWPALTLATFVIFRVSLRTAGLPWPHVLRVVAYTAGPIVLLTPLVLLMDFVEPWQYARIGRGWDELLSLSNPRGPALLVLSLWLAIRLAIAAQTYLRIPHGLWMAISSQVIVILLLVQLGLFAR